MTNISSIQQIENTLQFNNDDFSFIEKLHSFVNNSEFGEGYDDEESNKNYLWKSLSAIGNDIGETIYSNVRNFIQKITDVDTCGISQLNSLMQMLGFQYKIFENVDIYPIELKHIIDILSINKNSLMSNTVLKNSLISALYVEGCDVFGEYDRVISGSIQQISDYLNVEDVDDEIRQQLSSFVDNGMKMDSRIFNNNGDDISSDAFYQFSKHIFQNLLLDFLTLKHGENTYIITQVVDEDEQETINKFTESGYEDNIKTKYRDYKLQHGIEITFDENQIADDINDGKDSLDNYQGYYKDLLQTVIDNREENYQGVNNSRYAYYRTRKVKEYKNFILNKYYSVRVNKSDNIEYPVNSNFYEIRPDNNLTLFHLDNVPTEFGTIDNMTPIQMLENNVIDKNIFDTVVGQLLDTTNYIINLRQKIRLQLRKNYMKGTNNLLLYVINEYLLDYQKHNMLSDIQDYFEDNPPKIDNIKVIEYEDQTEYFNLQTDYDDISISSGVTTNEKFWKDRLDLEPYDVSKLNSFTLNDIQNFYLSVMDLKGAFNELSYGKENFDGEGSFLTNFLDTIYECGANTQSLNKGEYINTKLERNGQWTYELYNRLCSLTENYSIFKGFLSVGEYEFDSTTEVSNQISDVMYNFLFVDLSTKLLSGLSDVYDTFIDDVYEICSEIDVLETNYSNIISGDNSFYFQIPDKVAYPDCFDEYGNYKYDYYLGNPDRDNQTYIYDKFNALYSYCEAEDTIINHPLRDSLSSFRDQLTSLSSEHKSEIVEQLTTYGYLDIEAEYFGDEIDSTEQFIQDRITARITYLNNLIDSMKESAQNIRTSYNMIVQRLPQVVAEYKNTTGLTAFVINDFAPNRNGDATPSKEETTEGEISKGFKSSKGVIKMGDFILTGLYDPFTKMYYYDPEGELVPVDDQKFNCYYSGTMSQHNLDFDQTNMEEFLNNFYNFLNQETGIYVDKRKIDDSILLTITNTYYDYRDNGVAAGLASFKTQYDGIKDSAEQIIATIQSLFGESPESGSNLNDTIDNIISYLDNNGFTLLSKDEVLKFFNELKQKNDKKSQSFKSLELKYQTNILGDAKQGNYLAECVTDGSLTFSNIQKQLDYSVEKDKSNQEQLKNDIQYNLGLYSELQTRIQQLTREMQEYETLPQSYVYRGEMVEKELESIRQFLLDDIDLKWQRQMNIIQNRKNYMIYVMSNIQTEIVDYLEYTEDFNQVVIKQISNLDFYNNEKYLQIKEMFLEYGGNKISYYPYFNFKNKEHPSYQIHPFLWNFIESGNSIETLSKQFYSINIDDFEGEYIESTISNYIGEFGNVIDIWKNYTVDYSGYTSRYEYCSHTLNQIFSEVIDFDGIFFPKTIEDLKNNYDRSLCSMIIYRDGGQATKYQIVKLVESKLSDDITQFTSQQIYDIILELVQGQVEVEESLKDNIEQYLNEKYSTKYGLLQLINDNIPQTFYEKYYDHLQLTRYDIGQQVEKINEYWSQIEDITSDKTIDKVYDIFKYRRDINGNAFILLKQYNKESPTYYEKKNTLGQIWMRMNNYPLAFPAFTGKHPNVCMTVYNYCHPTIWRLNKIFPYIENIGELENGINDCTYFYDIHTSNNGYYIAFITYPTDKGRYVSKNTVQDSFNRGETIDEDYENSMIINGYSINITDTDGNIINTIYSSEDTSYKTEYIWSGYGQGERSHITTSISCLTQDTQNLAYIGSYNKGQSDAYHIYVNKLYKKNGDVELQNKLRICWFSDSNVRAYAENNNIIVGQSGQDCCFSYDSVKNTLTFVYLAEKIQPVYDYNGDIYENDNAEEINSYDILNRNIKTVKVTNLGQSIIQLKNGENKFNLHADISYTPAHPYKDQATQLKKPNSTLPYYNVELLGKSKDISKIESQINVKVNPYFDYSSISKDDIFGRVYESYEDSYDNTFRVYKNDLMNCVNYQDIVWIQKVDNEYSFKELANLEIISFNVDALGKKNYIFQNIQKLLEEEVYADYDVKMDESCISNIPYNVKINGLTYGKTCGTTNDHINGISSISYRMFNSDGQLSIRTTFHICHDEKQEEYIFIPKDKVNILLVNPYDLEQFNYYHLFDAYGMVYALSASGEIISQVITGNGWKIYRSNVGIDAIEDLTKYYNDRWGNQNKFNSFDIRQYQYLSDIWLFDTEKKLQFKYGEEIYFDLSSSSYYFPGLNRKYPKTMGQVAKERITLYNGQYCMSSYFTEDDLYVFDVLDEKSIIENISSVDIEVAQYTSDRRRVFEDYLGTSTTPDGRIIKNNEKYDINDEENMMQFYHCFEDGAIKEQESFVGSISKNKIKFNINEDSINIGQYIKLYVNYHKNESGDIVIYFNYFNFIDTPFVEIKQDGNRYPLIQEGSYLKLKTNEEGVLDFYIQLNYFEGNNIEGTQLLKLASFKVYNISDDKPKFTMKKIYDIKSGDSEIKEQPTIKISISDIIINMDELEDDDYGYSTLTIDIESNQMTTYPYTFEIEFPSSIITLKDEDGKETRTYKCVLDGTKLKAEVYSNTTQMTLDMKTTYTKDELNDYFNQEYPCYVSEYSINASDVVLADGIVNLSGQQKQKEKEIITIILNSNN